MRILASVSAAIFALFGALVVASSLPGCSSSSGATIAHVCPEGQTCQVNLTILHTSDIHSRLYPYEQVITQVDSTLGLGDLNAIANVGGVARMAYIINRERARSGRVIHLDSGDSFQGAPIFNFFKGEPETRALSALGVDAVVAGNHDFDLGAQNLATQVERWGNYTLLSANYRYAQAQQDLPSATVGRMSTVARPFTVLNSGGLKIGIIGMANLSSLTSVFDQPNRLGITPINSVDVAQFYIDLLRPYVDLIGIVSHMGLEVDQRVARDTTGIDFIMGGHNHIVINPPQEIRDCSADPNAPGYVWISDPNHDVDPEQMPPEGPDLDPVNHPWMIKRPCKPRRVVITHSGAFAKYVGRLDLVLTNEPRLASPTGDPSDYDPLNGFEIQSIRYQPFPINDSVPEDPVLVDLLQPYQRALQNVADLDILVGFSPQGSKRIASNGGDSPLGNVVGNAIWLRLGIQTDFSLTNSTGIRADLNPGPVTVEEMFNIFPFDNSITKMQLSGEETQELFDFSARRAAGRGCASQIQIAGARVRLNCAGCERLTVRCQQDDQCTSAVVEGHGNVFDSCDTSLGTCATHCNSDDDCALKLGGQCDPLKHTCAINACAEQVYIGTTEKVCTKDEDCVEDGKAVPAGGCLKSTGKTSGHCLSQLKPTNLYELATSNYLAGGGSGFLVLQRNTTQLDTKVQQRDALIDYLRAGVPCGYDANNQTQEGLRACNVDSDCGDQTFVCACPGHVQEVGAPVTCKSQGECGGEGRCVRADCRDQVAQFHAKRCNDAPDVAACRGSIGACQLGGEECKILTCIDDSVGSFTDNRVEMLGR